MDAIGTILAALGVCILAALSAAIARDGLGRNKTIAALDKDWNRMNVEVGAKSQP